MATSAYALFIILIIELLAPIVAQRNKLFYLRGNTTPTVYYYGSENVGHDQYYSGLITGANVKFGNYCFADPDVFDLIYSFPMDIVISGRDESNDCLYTHPDLPMIPISGFGNVSEYHDDGNPDALVISHGAAYGPAIEYCVEAGSLSEAMPRFANDILKIQVAVMREGRAPLSRETLRSTLNQSSTEECRDGNKYWGKKIDVNRAIAIALAGNAANSSFDISAINLLLLGEDVE